MDREAFEAHETADGLLTPDVSEAYDPKLIEAMERRVAIARAHARFLAALATIIGSTVVLSAIALGLLVIRDKSRGDASATARIKVLQTSLDDTRTRLATSDATASATQSCTLQFNAMVADAQATYLGSLGNLVVAIGKQLSPSVPADLSEPIATIEQDLELYDQAVSARSVWQTGGQVLPCPIG